MFKIIFIGVGLCALFLQSSGVPNTENHENAEYEACKTPAAQVVDEKFLTHTKFFVPFHSACENCKTADSNWKTFSGRTLAKDVCYTLSGSRKDGTNFDAKFKCKYTTPGTGSCEMQIDKPPYYAGNMIVTKTDNKTYMAGATCIFGKENFWWVAATTATIDDALKKEIMDDFHKKQFKENNLADPATSEIIFKEFHVPAGGC